jgi:hypothetical protein
MEDKLEMGEIWEGLADRRKRSSWQGILRCHGQTAPENQEIRVHSASGIQ